VLAFRASSAGNVADDNTAAFTFHSFEASGYNTPSKRDHVLAAGVRWSMRSETRGVFSTGSATINETMTTFSRDLEPEYLALSSDGKTVYVGLQENSDIAIFNLATKTFTDIKPLHTKSLS
jgi:DNA-binding beta-propeller fold protein YncE